MVEKVAQHAHCPVCGKAMPVEERTCSEECEEKLKLMIKKKRLWLYVFYGMLALFIILFFVLPYLGG